MIFITQCTIQAVALSLECIIHLYHCATISIWHYITMRAEVHRSYTLLLTTFMNTVSLFETIKPDVHTLSLQSEHNVVIYVSVCTHTYITYKSLPTTTFFLIRTKKD